jgi:hypothetical protein
MRERAFESKRTPAAFCRAGRRIPSERIDSLNDWAIVGQQGNFRSCPLSGENVNDYSMMIAFFGRR